MVDRRRFLLAAPVGAAALAVGGCSGRANDAAAAPAYSPTYLTKPEWAFVTTAVGRLIPDEGDGPGGLAAHVPEFIDRQLELPYGYGAFMYLKGPFVEGTAPSLGYQLRYSPREIYRLGIADANACSRQTFQQDFVSLSSARQDRMLQQMERGELRFARIPSDVLFAHLLANAREGYFADPQYGGNRDMVAWAWIGFPGARADFTDWIDQAGREYPLGPVSIGGTRS